LSFSNPKNPCSTGRLGAPILVGAPTLLHDPGYRRIVEARGYEILYTDVTTPDVALTGISVVRVTIPGLVPNFPAAFPFLGRRRIQQASVDLGWRRTALAEDELNYAPLPHA
jgi:ribosomal protein S12 methylthiotransferase accessory factor